MMKILLTGSTGYIGRRLLPLLVSSGHYVVCPVRDKRRFDFEDFSTSFLENVEVIECDFSRQKTLKRLPKDIDVAYYLIHAMASDSKDFKSVEIESAQNFARFISGTSSRQIIYLGGIANDENLS